MCIANIYIYMYNQILYFNIYTYSLQPVIKKSIYFQQHIYKQIIHTLQK
jgi:hypothetical protein